MRLTQKRIERWQADVERAEALLRRVEDEARQYRMASKGSRLDHLTGLTHTMLEVRSGAGKPRGGFVEVRERLTALAKAEARTHV